MNLLSFLRHSTWRRAVRHGQQVKKKDDRTSCIYKVLFPFFAAMATFFLLTLRSLLNFLLVCCQQTSLRYIINSNNLVGGKFPMSIDPPFCWQDNE